MKYFRICTTVAAALMMLLSLSLSSCKDKKKSTYEEILEEMKPQMELSRQDTAEVEYLTRTYMDYLQKKDYDAALAMLSYVDRDSNITTMPKGMVEQQRMIYKVFPVLKYHIENVIFHSEDDSQVKVIVEFFELKPGDTRKNTTTFFFKPVRRDGKWYLTIYDSLYRNGKPSVIEN